MSRFSTLLVFAVLPAALAAQAHPLVGTWTMSVPVGMRIENGEATAITVKGTLAVVAQGDSLIATLTTEGIEGRPPRPASRLAALQTAGKVTFVLSSEARINMNGEESTRTAHSTFILEANGDSLQGTFERKIEGLPDADTGPQPLTGTRVK